MHYERRRALAGGVHTCVISTDYLHEVLRTCATFRARRYASRVQKLLHKSNDQLTRLLIMAKIVCADHTGLDHLSRPLPVDKLGKPGALVGTAVLGKFDAGTQNEAWFYGVIQKHEPEVLEIA
jgi:hypothetical protein